MREINLFRERKWGIHRKREKYVERESQRAIRSNVERDKILLERDNFVGTAGPLERESEKSGEKWRKWKEKKKEKETLRTWGQGESRGARVNFFFFFLLKLNWWVTCDRERKKNLWSWIQLWAAVGVGGLLLVGLEKKFNNVF